MGTFSIWHWIIVLLFVAIAIVPPYWGMKKAGWSGWWCLVFLVPLVNLIFLWVFAFANWPNELISGARPIGNSAQKYDNTSQQQEAAISQTVVQDFGALMQTMEAGTYYDVSRLPHPKGTILKSLLYALRITEDSHIREQLRVGLVFLAQFQEGVGPAPISTMPVDIANLTRRMEAGEMSPDEVAEEIAKASSRVDESKIKHLESICEAETKKFLAMGNTIASG